MILETEIEQDGAVSLVDCLLGGGVARGALLGVSATSDGANPEHSKSKDEDYDSQYRALGGTSGPFVAGMDDTESERGQAEPV